MKPEHFFYWLQGYFELSGTQDPITDKQAACILSHIEIVEASGPTANVRVIEIRTLLSMLETSREMVTAEVRKRISDEFIHVIDPQAGGVTTQAHLNGLHGWKPGEPKMRC